MLKNLKGQIINFIKDKYFLLIVLISLYFPAKIIVVKFKQLAVINNDTWCLELFIYFILLIKIIFLAFLLAHLIIYPFTKAYSNIQNNKLSKIIKNIEKLSIKTSMIVFFVSIVINIILLHFIYNLNKDNLENLLVLILMNELFLYTTISILYSASKFLCSIIDIFFDETE